jgi:serine/threonine protein kinase
MDPSPFEPAISEQFRIERELGRGGMAIVYLAQDLRHGRQVALKVLRPELSASIGADRFLREIRIAANLSHPSILPLYDSAITAGPLFYVMPYVEGETLRTRMARGRLANTEIALLGAEIADALDYAHRKGVVHRDIKPDNILLFEGRALVADFGIAHAIREAGGENLTATGFLIGTPNYMSPEQASGERVVDGRSDVFSLGSMLYEMLTGEAPFIAPTAAAIMARILTAAPKPLEEQRPDLPPALVRAVMRSLNKAPADRWTTAGEFAAALRGAVAGNSTAAMPPTRVSKAQPRSRRGFVTAATVAAAAIIVTVFLAKNGTSSDDNRNGTDPFPDSQTTISGGGSPPTPVDTTPSKEPEAGRSSKLKGVVIPEPKDGGPTIVANTGIQVPADSAKAKGILDAQEKVLEPGPPLPTPAALRAMRDTAEAVYNRTDLETAIRAQAAYVVGWLSEELQDLAGCAKWAQLAMDLVPGNRGYQIIRDRCRAPSP